jgi:hypothetical protein
MNTGVVTLLIGVGDSGDIGGIDADKFPNEDKYLQHYSNIFNQHIGLVFTEYVDFTINSVDAQKYSSYPVKNHSSSHL